MSSLFINTKSKSPLNYWFTSDTHYNHKNICRGVSSWPDTSYTRDFGCLYEMNQAIVDNINNNVMEDDVLFHLGDWSFGGFDYIEEFRNRILCNNIILITGNHDHHIINNRGNCKNLFSGVYDYLDLKIEYEIKKGVTTTFNASCLHYPIASWNNMNEGRFHLHGHVHLPPDKKVNQGKAMDVGLEGHPEFRPYSLKEITDLLSNRPNKRLFIPQDHHEDK